MSELKTPKGVILERLNSFAASAPDRVYKLYSAHSDLVKFFPTYEQYLEQYKKLVGEHEVLSLNIVKESIYDNYSEVLYEERFRYGDVVKIFYCKATLIIEDGLWKILYEEKECSG